MSQHIPKTQGYSNGHVVVGQSLIHVRLFDTHGLQPGRRLCPCSQLLIKREDLIPELSNIAFQMLLSSLWHVYEKVSHSCHPKARLSPYQNIHRPLILIQKVQFAFTLNISTFHKSECDQIIYNVCVYTHTHTLERSIDCLILGSSLPIQQSTRSQNHVI